MITPSQIAFSTLSLSLSLSRLSRVESDLTFSLFLSLKNDLGALSEG